MFGWLARLLSPQIPRPDDREERWCPPADAGEREWCEYLACTEPIQRLGDPRMEVVLADKSRCDILTTQVAWEVDFARKWREGVKQAIHYGALTGRRGGLILLYDPARDGMYFQLTKMVLSRYHAGIRPELVLCNILNGGLQGAIFEVVDATIVAPKPPAKTRHYLAGCLFLLICVCCLPWLLVLSETLLKTEPSQQEYRTTPPATEAAVPRVQAAASDAETMPRSVEPLPVEIPIAQAPGKPSKADDQSDAHFGTPPIPSGRKPKSVADPTQQTLVGMRTWMDSSGKHSVEAEYLNFQNGEVQLRKRDGQVIGVPTSRLSQADVNHLMAGIREQGGDRAGLVTAVGHRRPELCEIHFNMEVQSWQGKWLALYRGETFLGLVRVVATRGNDLVADTADIRARIGDAVVPLTDSPSRRP